MRTAADIASLYKARAERLGPLHARAREVRDTYNSDVAIPLPEVSRYERSAVANLTQQGLDQIARRVASVLPTMTYPPLRPGIKVAEEKARTRTRVNYGWWEQTNIKKVLARRSRHFLGYAKAPVLVRPDAAIGGPRWEPYSPLDVYEAPVHLDGSEPADVIVCHKRTLEWIEAKYPAAARMVHKREDAGPDTLFDVLEYIDAEQVSFVVLGQAKQDDYGQDPSPETMAVDMSTMENRAGICWAVVPQRVALDRPIGHFDGILGMYQTQAAVTAMEIIHARKSIFPDTWLVNPNTGAQPTIVQEPDYEAGTPGIVVNGIIDRQELQPNFAASQLADRLEYAQRMTAGLPAEMGGVASRNVRTGRGADRLLGASIDFTIAESQDAFAESLRHENVRAIKIDKAYFNSKKTFFVSTKGQRGQVEYKPSDVFDSDQHIVEYPIAGTDLSDLVINGGQRLAQETLSARSFMEIDPLVSDVDEEERRVQFEKLRRVFFMQIEQEGSTPGGPWESPDLARLAKFMFADELDWYEAVDKLQKEKQEEQAAGAPPGAPETMPGLAAPGAGVEVPTIGEPSPSMGNLTQILNQLGSADTALAMR